MTDSLHALFSAIHNADTEAELRSQVIPQLGAYFAATRQGLFLFEGHPCANRQLQAALRLGLSVEHNPVIRYVVERHIPVHEALVASPKTWAMICPRADHWHVMAGPIVSHGRLVGGIGLTRGRAMSAFDAQNLADLSAICLHLSTWVVKTSVLPELPPKLPLQSSKTHHLTPRELEIAHLVALGHTNAEIGRQLWITENSVKQALKRMFRKLGVSSRTEMVTSGAA